METKKSYCICGKFIGHKGFCSKECREIYEKSCQVRQGPKLDLFKIYTLKSKKLVEFNGPPNVLKSYKKCSCGGDMKTVPLNHYYVEHDDGYYIIDINNKGHMILSPYTTKMQWTCDSCMFGESIQVR